MGFMNIDVFEKKVLKSSTFGDFYTMIGALSKKA
jgi:hypothetical protein